MILKNEPDKAAAFAATSAAVFSAQTGSGGRRCKLHFLIIGAAFVKK